MTALDKFIAGLIILLAAIGLSTVVSLATSLVAPCGEVSIQHNAFGINWIKERAAHCSADIERATP